MGQGLAVDHTLVLVQVARVSETRHAYQVLTVRVGLPSRADENFVLGPRVLPETSLANPRRCALTVRTSAMGKIDGHDGDTIIGGANDRTKNQQRDVDPGALSQCAVMGER